MLRVFGCMVASRGGYRMARGWHYAKLSLSNAPRLSFSGLCILLFLFLSLCRFCVFLFFFCSHWSLVDVPLIFFCPADHVPDWQPRILLGMVEARSVNVKKTTTTTTRVPVEVRLIPAFYSRRSRLRLWRCCRSLRTSCTWRRTLLLSALALCNHSMPSSGLGLVASI